MGVLGVGVTTGCETGFGVGAGAEEIGGNVREVILALNPSVEGDATSLYLTKLLKPLGTRVSRLAAGIPVGGQLEFTDRQTLARALENRMEASG